jgi:hypothetical protein
MLPPDPGEHHLPHYRAYIVGRDGHFIEAIDLDCANDAAAVDASMRFVDGNDVEVWQGGRMVSRLDRNPAIDQ